MDVNDELGTLERDGQLCVLRYRRVLRQSPETFAPELVDEGPQLAEPLGARPVQAPVPVDANVHQPRFAQRTQVLRRGGPGPAALFRQLAGADLCRGDDLQRPALCRARQHVQPARDLAAW